MDSIGNKGGFMIKKIFVLIAMVPFFLIAQDGFSGRGGHHEIRHERAKAKIEKQHQRKTERLEKWKEKRLEKCGTNQACINRVNHQAGMKANQIDKQYEARKEAFEKHDEKHPAETPADATPDTGSEQAPSTGGTPMTESR